MTSKVDLRDNEGIWRAIQTKYCEAGCTTEPKEERGIRPRSG